MIINSIMCPLSDKRVNERVARINATFTVLILLAFIFSHNILILAFLAIDYLIRTSDLSRYSLIGMSSRTIVKYLAINEYFINAGPKILAARIGLFLTCLIILSYLLKATLVAFVLTGILGLFSTLEAVFGICVACRMYPYLFKFFYGSKFQ